MSNHDDPLLALHPRLVRCYAHHRIKLAGLGNLVSEDEYLRQYATTRPPDHLLWDVLAWHERMGQARAIVWDSVGFVLYTLPRLADALRCHDTSTLPPYDLIELIVAVISQAHADADAGTSPFRPTTNLPATRSPLMSGALAPMASGNTTAPMGRVVSAPQTSSASTGPSTPSTPSLDSAIFVPTDRASRHDSGSESGSAAPSSWDLGSAASSSWDSGSATPSSWDSAEPE